MKINCEQISVNRGICIFCFEISYLVISIFTLIITTIHEKILLDSELNLQKYQAYLWEYLLRIFCCLPRPCLSTKLKEYKSDIAYFRSIKCTSKDEFVVKETFGNRNLRTFISLFYGKNFNNTHVFYSICFF